MPTLLTLDFETYYDQQYSLSKITTEEYIRSDLYETIGVAIHIDGGETIWYPQPEVENALKSIDWSDKLLVCQNTAFDGAILAWRYGIHPMALFDIMGMSRALYPHEKSHSLKSQAERHGVGVKGTEVVHALGKRYADFSKEDLAKYGEYCINDVVLTRKLFDIYMGMGFSKQELKLIDLTLRMYIQPVLTLDGGMLVEHLRDTKERKESLIDTVKGLIPESEYTDDIKSMLMSNAIFANALQALGVEPPMKISARTKKLAYAFAKTDEEFLGLEEHPDVRVQALVAARLGNKSTIEETRTERFLGMAGRGVFPVPLRYYGTHTGRWSGCLVADTWITVYDPVLGVVEKRITDVLANDLVWDGVEFVMHEGVQFSGYQEVISWDNVAGTPEHVVFTDAGEISLRDAMQGGHRIQTPSGPSQNLVDAARRLANDYQK